MYSFFFSLVTDTRYYRQPGGMIPRTDLLLHSSPPSWATSWKKMLNRYRSLGDNSKPIQVQVIKEKLKTCISKMEEFYTHAC
jgi:hypothetical protein